MKNPVNIQKKLLSHLKNHPTLHVSLRVPCSEEEFKEIACVVQDYIYYSGDVTNDDPIHEWLEEYKFYLSEAN